MLPEERPAAGASGGVGPHGMLTGRILDGRYRIGEVVARGGMATVYEADDVRLDRTVAVKVMHPTLGDPVSGSGSFADRFVREARAAARLSHPNVVSVHDQGSDDGVTFLVMELVPGTTLREVIREQSPLAPSQALSFLEPIVAAVAAAHRAGIVHRDVKPENVLIADDGRVKVADFGLARAIDSESHHTTTGGVLIGTVSYLAPELVAEGIADARVDVYALGVVLYELLTGEKPHQGETPLQIAYKHVHSDVPAPSLITSGIPPYVDALVARATSRDRGQRPADAGVLLHHVRRVAHALAEGVADDADLTADLLPRSSDETDWADETDTSPDRFDSTDLEELRGAGFADAELYPALAHASGPETTSRLDLDSDTVVRAPLRGRRGRSTGYGEGGAAGGDGGEGGAYPGGLDQHDDDLGDHGDHGEDHDGDRDPSDDARRRGPLLIGLVVILALLAAGLYGWNEWRTVSTPDLVGLNVEDATSLAEREGFEVEVAAARYSDDLEVDEVIASDPEPGADTPRGSTITITPSLGPRIVPELVGKSEPETRTLLGERDLTFAAADPVYSEDVPAGQVISSDPEAGTRVREGDEVTVVISAGRRPVPVSDFTGDSAEDARSALETGDPEVDGDELVVEVVEEFSDDVPEGVVIAQDPSEGTLYFGDTVTLTVSKGPPIVTIPGGLIGSSVDDARAQLEDLGLVVEEEGVFGADPNRRLGFVTAVSPGSGEEVRRGSTVVLTVL